MNKINFDTKLGLLGKLKLISDTKKDKAKAISVLRNKLVHSTGKKIKYKDNEVTSKSKVVNQLVLDYIEITKDIQARIEGQKLYRAPDKAGEQR